MRNKMVFFCCLLISLTSFSDELETLVTNSSAVNAVQILGTSGKYSGLSKGQFVKTELLDYSGLAHPINWIRGDQVLVIKRGDQIMRFHIPKARAQDLNEYRVSAKEAGQSAHLMVTKLKNSLKTQIQDKIIICSDASLLPAANGLARFNESDSGKVKAVVGKAEVSSWSQYSVYTVYTETSSIVMMTTVENKTQSKIISGYAECFK